MRKNTLEQLLPLILELKRLLESRQSPLLKHVMLYLMEIMNDYKQEMEDILAADRTLASEIQYDIKRFADSRKKTTLSRSLAQEDADDASFFHTNELDQAASFLATQTPRRKARASQNFQVQKTLSFTPANSNATATATAAAVQGQTAPASTSKPPLHTSSSSSSARISLAPLPVTPSSRRLSLSNVAQALQSPGGSSIRQSSPLKRSASVLSTPSQVPRGSPQSQHTGANSPAFVSPKLRRTVSTPSQGSAIKPSSLSLLRSSSAQQAQVERKVEEEDEAQIIRRERTNIDSDDDTDDEAEPKVSKPAINDSGVSNEPVLIKMNVSLDGKEPAASASQDEFSGLDENENYSNTNLDVSAELEQLSIKKRKVESESDSAAQNAETSSQKSGSRSNKRKGR